MLPFMEFQGRYVFPSSCQEVWRALKDPNVLALCLPGSKGVTRSEDNVFHVTATVKIGSHNTRFTGRFLGSERPPGLGVDKMATITGEIDGGADGSGRIRI